MRRLKIYYLLGKESRLTPVSGDRINEMNIIRALSKYFDIYYNGEICDFKDKSFGRSDGRLVSPKEGEYDLVYVRNNKKVFLDSPAPKLWFASPYDEQCFEEADGIVCMTTPWKERLKLYSENDFEYFCGMYPKTMKPPRNCLLFPQTIAVPSDSELHKFKTGVSLSSIYTKFKSKLGLNTGTSIRPRIARHFDPKRIIRHFGPIRETNYPHQLIHMLESNKQFAYRWSAECVGPRNSQKLPSVLSTRSTVSQSNVMELLINSHATWYNQNESGNIAGSLKILEAMSAGIPILCPRYDARECELGAEYPFFWELEPGTKITDSCQVDFEEKLQYMIEMCDIKRNHTSEYLRERAYAFSFDSTSKILRSEIEISLSQI